MTPANLWPDIRKARAISASPALDLSISSNLYITDQQGIWFEEVMTDQDYRQSVSESLNVGENAWVELLDKTKLRSKNRSLAVIDCGPANPDESIRKLKKLMQTVQVNQYVAIDMNDHLLSKIKLHVSNALGIPTRFVQSRFEDLTHDDLGDTIGSEAVVLFGSTEMNYEVDELTTLLTNFCKPGMLIAFESLLRTSDQSVLGYESKAVRRFAFGPLWLLGAHEDQFEFHPFFWEKRIILEFVSKMSVETRIDEYPLLQRGDTVWTAFSRRPTAEQHKKGFAQIAEPVGTIISVGRIASSIGRFR